MIRSNIFNVLVVSGGGFQGLTLIKCLRFSKEVRVIMVDSSEENISKYFVDKFYVVPPVVKKAMFINSLLKICFKEKINLVIPATDIELSILSENIRLFKSKGIEVAVSTHSFLRTIEDKVAVHKLLKNENLPILPLLDIDNNSLKFPILGKPVKGCGSKGIIYLNSRQDLEKSKSQINIDNYIWQPFLRKFEEFSIDCAINFDGKISDLSIRKRLKTLNGFCAIAESADDVKIKKLTKKFLKLAFLKGGRGIFNIQVLKCGSRYYLSDINPRIGTSAIFSCRQGINLPLFLCSYVRPDMHPSGVRRQKNGENLKMIRYLEELWVENEVLEGIKGIVFDLDDVLLNQKLWIIGKLEKLWEKFKDILPGKHKFLLQAIRSIEESNRDRLFDELVHKLKLRPGIKNNLISAYREIIPENNVLFSDTVFVLKELKKRRLKLGLLTDNPVESQKQKINATGLSDFFDAIIYSGELEEEKPAKKTFIKISRCLKIPPRFLIMVGDNLYRDIIGSREAGFKFAYWLTREGCFFNFDQNLLKKVGLSKYSFKKINDLRGLLQDFN